MVNETKLAKTANLLGTNWWNIAKTSFTTGKPSLDSDVELEAQLKSIYEEANYTKQFKKYLNTQFLGDVVASDEDKTEMYKVNQLLMTKDGRILNHYQRQAESDPNYRQSIKNMTKEINAKEENITLSLLQSMMWNMHLTEIK